jgi:xanthine dehydrogenase accessory factor
MDETLRDVASWMQAGASVALATVVRTWGSAPRPAGSKMGVRADGEVVGSVSAGCVEAAVVAEALEVLKDGQPRRLHYGVADETAWQVGLTCGGDIDIFVESVACSGAFLSAAQAAASPDMAPIVRSVAIGGPQASVGSSILIEASGRLVEPAAFDVPEGLVEDALSAMQEGAAAVRRYAVAGVEWEFLLDPWLPPPTLVIVGGVHIAIVLARLARAIGYRVVVIEPRRAFATPQRFPEVDLLETSWPDEGLRRLGLTAMTAVAALSHDPKLDDPALLLALRSPAFYVGALGSWRTNEQRRERLLAAGLQEEELRRLHAPIGLDLGRLDPEGIALSVLAEIVAARAGRDGAARQSRLKDHVARKP